MIISINYLMKDNTPYCAETHCKPWFSSICLSPTRHFISVKQLGVKQFSKRFDHYLNSCGDFVHDVTKELPSFICFWNCSELNLKCYNIVKGWIPNCFVFSKLRFVCYWRPCTHPNDNQALSMFFLAYRVNWSCNFSGEVSFYITRSRQ